MPIVAEENHRNFITKILSYSKICSVPNSMSVLDELLPIVLKMMGAGITGTVNLTNPGVISHNEILEMYQKHVDPEFTWNNFSIEEQRSILMCDRSNNWLDTSVLEAFAPEVRHIKDAVEDTIKKYKNTVAVSESESKESKESKECKVEHDEAISNSTMCNNTLRDDAVLFVTGGAGFIGSHFINNIYYSTKYKNIKIINFDALYYCANEKENIINEIRQDVNRYTFIHGNLKSLDLLTHIFKTNAVTHVVHFAAQSHVQTSFTDALTYTQDNIIGTHNLLKRLDYIARILKNLFMFLRMKYMERMKMRILKRKSPFYVQQIRMLQQKQALNC